MPFSTIRALPTSAVNLQVVLAERTVCATPSSSGLGLSDPLLTIICRALQQLIANSPKARRDGLGAEQQGVERSRGEQAA